MLDPRIPYPRPVMPMHALHAIGFTAFLGLPLPLLAHAPHSTPPDLGASAELPASLLITLVGLTSSDCLIDDSSFTSSDGGCLDLATGLVWGTSSLTFPGNVPPFSSTTWNTAVAYCDTLVESGYSDWYLPSKNQMLDVIANGGATHLDLGVTVPIHHWWSSTTKGGQRAWMVDLIGGNTQVVLKESRLPYVCVRDASTSTTPPAAPTGLSAIVVSGTQINLAWADASSDETSFVVDRSLDGASWTTLAVLPANTEGYGDGLLVPGQQYYYRVSASNLGGVSGYSNTVSATTPNVGSLAYAEVFVEGSTTGTYQSTWSDDDVYESITEIHTGGPPSNRISRLEHRWVLTAAPGATVTLHVQAYRNDTGEGDEFELAYAEADYSHLYTTLPGTLAKTADDDIDETFTLPATLSGTVYIRVRDTNRNPGFGAQDTLHVDHIFIVSQ